MVLLPCKALPSDIETQGNLPFIGAFIVFYPFKQQVINARAAGSIAENRSNQSKARPMASVAASSVVVVSIYAS
jgi:hypothetical protein